MPPTIETAPLEFLYGALVHTDELTDEDVTVADLLSSIARSLNRIANALEARADA